MTTDGHLPISTWLGALTHAGVLDGESRAGMLAAIAVVGEEALLELRTWFSKQPEHVCIREKCAAIDTLIWVAQADRRVVAPERDHLREVIERSELPPDTQRFLRGRLDQNPDLESLTDRLTHPVLRRLVLALAWDLAQADGRVDPTEQHRYFELAKWLELPTHTADRIARTMQRG